MQISLLCFLFLTAATVVAQRPGGPGFDPEQQTEQLIQKLELRPDQIPRVRDIHRQTAEKIRAAREAGDRVSMRAQMPVILEAQEKALEAVLDAEQQKKYQSMQQSRRRGRP